MKNLLFTSQNCHRVLQHPAGQSYPILSLGDSELLIDLNNRLNQFLKNALALSSRLGFELQQKGRAGFGARGPLMRAASLNFRYPLVLFTYFILGSL